jgi:hypothetical protein
MKGLPLRFGVVTDYGESRQREVMSVHTSAVTARRRIFENTASGYLGDAFHYWVAEINMAGVRRSRSYDHGDEPFGAEYRLIKIIGYLPEGPYSTKERPSVESRRT